MDSDPPVNRYLGDYMVIALIPAGGIGSRYGSENKLLVRLGNGRTALEQVVATFAEMRQFSRIVVALHKSLIGGIDFDIGNIEIIEGGESRSHSVWKLLRYCRSYDPQYVIIHDAARPLLTQSLILQTLDAVAEFGAVTVGSKMVDTVRICRETSTSGDLRISEFGEFLDREKIHRILTPQAFRFSTIQEAYHGTFGAEDFVPNGCYTDCASVVERIYPVKVLYSEKFNIKLTTSDDKRVIDALLSVH